MRLMTCLALVAVLGLAAGLVAVHVPASPARADEPGRAAAKPIPFRLAKPDKPLILLETMVDGRGPFRVALDTGAGGTMISRELAKKLGITPDARDKPGKATGAGGHVEVRLAAVKSLRVGGAKLEGLKVGIMDLSGIGEAIETDIDGILGYNFLKEYRVTIDYPKQTVTFE